MVGEMEEHVGQVVPENEDIDKKMEKLRDTHMVCHSLGRKCLNLRKTKLEIASAMLGLS